MSKSMTLITTLALIGLVGAVGCDKKKETPKAKVDEVKKDDKKMADKKPAAKVDEKKDDKKMADMTEVAVDTSASKIEWYGSKVVTGDHTGAFKKFDGKVWYNKAGELAKLSFTVDTDSITSDAEKLTVHLKSPDFFNVEKFPKAMFESTAIKAKAADKFTHEITGDMTILGKKKSITFPATVKTDGDKFVADTQFVLKRDDFGMTYGAVNEEDKSLADKIKDKAIKKDVKLTIHLEAPKK